jgi:hypothetical protein
MLEINVQPYASDALEDAMSLSQTKALNSYSWSECLNYLNYAWMDMYKQIALIDEGYYSKTIRLTRKLTKLPAHVKNSIQVFATQHTNNYNREVFRASGYNDLNGWNTYHISGFDLYCPQAERRTVWLTYLPQEPMIFFTRNNRDPKLYEDYTKTDKRDQTYSMWEVQIKSRTTSKYYIDTDVENQGTPYQANVIMHYRNPMANLADVDITQVFERAIGYDDGVKKFESEWVLTSFICDYPYIFVTYHHKYTDEHYSGFFRNLPESEEFVEYNPFAYTGRNSNVEYLAAKWNDKTGLGVFVKDWNDLYVNKLNQTVPRIKELGWTPDTLLIYPTPEMYRLLVARLADKFAALNESSIMGVQKELVEAEYGFKAFLGKDKSSWVRITNVNGPGITDWL